MKKIGLCLCLLAALLLHKPICGQGTIQTSGKFRAQGQTCITDVIHQQLLQTNPNYAANTRHNEEAIYQHTLNGTVPPEGNNTYRSISEVCYQPQEVYTVPVVVHIVHRSGIAIGTAENLTDAQVINAINLCNNLYAHTSGATFTNPFSGTNVGIALCLAARDPQGNPSTGIVRHESNTLSTNSFVSYNTQNALNWNPTQYLNVYIVYQISGGSTSGYSTLATSHGESYDGVLIQYDSWWEKLLAHETGHYFNLYHTFEDGCPNNNCLTDGDRVCDTPPKGTSGGTSYPACSPSNTCPNTDDDDTDPRNPFRPIALGGLGNQPDANENYMDYSGSCWAAFTQGQRTRMRIALTTLRSSLLTSEACMPIAPHNAGLTANVYPADILCETTFSPIITLKNFGTANLTQVNIAVELDNLPAYTYNWSGNLAPNETTNVTLLPLTISAAGQHHIYAYTQNPNGNADAYANNDAICFEFTHTPPITLAPYCADVEAGALPPNWQIMNPDGQIGFDVFALGNCAQNGNYVIRYNSFGTNIGSNGTTDELLLPAIDLNGYTNAQFSFSRAYIETYANLISTLTVSVSDDCGISYTPLYTASGATLATTSGTATEAWQPTDCSQWASQNIGLNNYLNSTILLKFTVTLSGVYGQNLYLDNICLNGTTNCQPPMPVITAPVTAFCAGGNALLTASSIPPNYPQHSYQWLQNGNIIAGATAQTLLVNSAGTYSVQLINAGCTPVSSATLSITQFSGGTMPVNQNFSAGLNTNGWQVVNPDAGSPTWTSGSSICNGAAALMPNFGNNNVGQQDYLYSAVYNLSNYASASVSFEVAYAAYSPTQSDVLQVQVSEDCGQSYTTLYNKSGSLLATAPNTTASFQPTSCTQWRTETINLSAYLGTQVLLRLVNINGNGNNLYVDNITLSGVLSCVPPPPTITPTATQLCPAGTAFLIASDIPSGYPTYTYRWLLNGNPIGGATSQILSVSAAGSYTVQLYSTVCTSVTSAPVQITLFTTGTLPMSQQFEAGLTSNGWQAINPDAGSPAWALSSTTCSGAAALMPNFGNSNTGQQDYLVSAVYNLSSYDVATLSFDVAYAAYSPTQSDALQVQVSVNCGQTYTTLYNKSGIELATAPNTTASFQPANCTQWRTETINLSAYLNPQVLIRFVNTNGNGNNLYLDNIELNAAITTRAYAQLWLQGCYNSGTNQMNTGLSNAAILPAAQPFNRFPWYYAGTEQLSSNMNSIVDWLLADALDANYNLIERRAVLLRNDGHIVSPDGSEGILFSSGNVVNGNAYRLRIYPRNHIGVVSSNVFALPNEGNAYLFTQPANVAGGGSQLVSVGASGYALRAGDVLPNGIINYADFGVLFQQTGASPAAYYDADLNLDGNVNTADFDLLRGNTGSIGVLPVRQ